MANPANELFSFINGQILHQTFTAYKQFTVKEISALSGLTNLEQLHLSNNQIRDISALSGLTNLEVLYLRDNPVLREKSREEIMEVLSGAEKLTDSDY